MKKILLILLLSFIVFPEEDIEIDKDPFEDINRVVFVIFDVETVFLYPWAVAFHRLGLLAFIEALVFITILVVALAYAWRKGALEWS